MLPVMHRPSRQFEDKIATHNCTTRNLCDVKKMDNAQKTRDKQAGVRGLCSTTAYMHARTFYQPRSRTTATAERFSSASTVAERLQDTHGGIGSSQKRRKFSERCPEVLGKQHVRKKLVSGGRGLHASVWQWPRQPRPRPQTLSFKQILTHP